ncbi:MAG: SulP family inorganic anion transporter [Bacteroidota bacterium]
MKNMFSNIRGDFFGGITAGIVALPLALAFGQQTELGAAAGLFGAIFIGFFASLFGGTGSQISGPTAPMTAVSYLIIANIIQSFDGVIEKALPTILLVFFLAGLLQILLGILGAGKYIKYIPYPVVSGFMTGIGVIIIITQLFPVMGYSPGQDTDLVEQYIPRAEERLLDKILINEAEEGIKVLEDYEETIRRGSQITRDEILLEAQIMAKKETGTAMGTVINLPRAVNNVNLLHFILVLATIFIIYGFKRITKAVPSTLVALLVITLLVVIVGWNVSRIDDIPIGFPKLYLNIFSDFSFAALRPELTAVFSLAFLGAIDSLLTSVIADNITKTKHNSNKELVGQGIGNGMAALFGGLPGAGATIRTVVNINAGGKTKLSGIIAALLLLAVLLALGPLASNIPKAVLAGILITVGIGVMDYKGLKAIPKMPLTDVIVMLLVLILTVFLGLIEAVVVGMIIATVIFMKKMGDVIARNSNVKPLAEEKAWEDETSFPKNLKEEVYIKHIKGPIFFGSTTHFQEMASQIPETVSHLIIRMDRVPYIDQSGLYAMEDILVDLTRAGKKILIVGLNDQPRYLMERIDIVPDLVPEEAIFDSFDDCMIWIKHNIEDLY